MAITALSDGRIVLSNAEYFHVTPYTSESEIGDKTYDIVDIVGDSLSFTPDDNSINSKESEFTDAPLFENVTLGKIQFAATCIDFRNEIMEKIFGWSAGSSSKAMYAPNGYKEIYAAVEVGFKNSDTVVIAPKLKLNSKAVISSLKTGSAEAQLAGTAYDANLVVGTDTEVAPTSMAFAPRFSDADAKTAMTYVITIGEKKYNFAAGNDKEDSGFISAE